MFLCNTIHLGKKLCPSVSHPGKGFPLQAKGKMLLNKVGFVRALFGIPQRGVRKTTI